jgi:uncharacterized protein YbaR (Trm112 family)
MGVRKFHHEPSNSRGESLVKKELISILACPVCKGPLVLDISHENAGDIISGSLKCDPCKEIYLIDNSIPNLLPPHLRE